MNMPLPQPPRDLAPGGRAGAWLGRRVAAIGRTGALDYARRLWISGYSSSRS